MREDEAGRTRAPWRSSSILSRLASVGAHLSGAVLLAAGVANTIAARRDRKDDGKRDADGKSGRDDRKDRSQDDAGEDRKSRRDDRDADRERKERDVEREESDDSSRDRANRKRDRDNDNADGAGSDVDAEQTTPTPTPRSGQNNNRNNNEANNNDGGGNSNAGSGAFDNPLATKARRRAKDFDNRDRVDEEEEGIVVDVDPEGESIYQTESISYATGPDGVEILTRNITYIAAPTPTPTPFPRLEFPERDGYPFGEDFPFGVTRPTPTPTTGRTDPGEPVPDPGDTPPRADPLPTTPPTDDGADGGDNSTDFAS